MPIRFHCPACRKPLSIGSRMAGTRTVCPLCKDRVVVPEEANFHEPPSLETPVPLDDQDLEPAVAKSIPVALPTGQPSSHQSARSVSASVPGRLPFVPPTSGRQRLLDRAIVAVVLLAVFVNPLTVALIASRGEQPGPEQAQAPPAPQQQRPRQVPAVAQVAGLPEVEATRTVPMAAPEPVPAENGAGVADPYGPGPGDKISVAPPQSPAPSPPVQKVEPAAVKEVRVAEPAPAVKLEAPRLEPKATAVVLERLRNKRRSHLTDAELRRQALMVPEVSLDAVPGSTKNIIAESTRQARSGVDVMPAFMATRPDLVGLRPRTGNDARMSNEEALTLQTLSQHLRRILAASIPGVDQGGVGLRPDPAQLRERLLNDRARATWLGPNAVSALRQLFMHEERNVRLILIEALSLIEGPQATQALVGCAMFDLHPDVRAAALVALKRRPAEEYEPALIWGLRYPWPAVADHAAEALVALDLREAVPRLVPLLDAKDPGEPFPVDWAQKRLTMVTDLVRINHLSNCLMCHPQSFSAADPVRAKAADGCTFIRADITYLKQDFSMLQPVANHGPRRPANQRFDYMVRLRPLGKDELLLWQEKNVDPRPIMPQRQALLFALRELTGEDLGPSVEDWKRQYSTVTGQRLPQPLEADEQVLHLKDCLVAAVPLRQAELLQIYKDRAGTAYDRAVLLALPQMQPELQKMGRLVLSDRMHGLSLKQLGARLHDPDEHVRRAAVRACYMREEMALVPELITLLDDGSDIVAKQALYALRQLTSKDFGPRPSADAEQRRQATAAWREWWEQQERRRAEQKRAAS